MSNQAAPFSSPDAAEPTRPDRATDAHPQPVVIRRSPRYFRLMGLFAGIGVIAAFISAFSVKAPEGYSQAQVFGYLLLWGGVAGVVLGALIALILDRMVGRKTTALTAHKVAVTQAGPDVAQNATPDATADATRNATMADPAGGDPATTGDGVA